jgi:site-specific DNA recombinase
VEVSLLIQKLVFPEGLAIDPSTRNYLTKRLNSIFALISDIAKESDKNKKGTNQKNDDLSLVVAGTGLSDCYFLRSFFAENIHRHRLHFG